MLSILALVLSLFAADPAAAQGCGPQNPNCIVPTAPVGTSNNQAASTEFVNTAIGGAPITPSPLTKTDDTNVTVTLGGTPATALLKATSITMGWAGSLAVGRGGTNCLVAGGTCLDNITGFGSTGFLKRTGAGAYSFVPLPVGPRLAKTANYTAVTGDCGSMFALGGSTFFTLTFSAASGYASDCAFWVTNEDTGRAKFLSINGFTGPAGLTGFFLWPGQTVIIFNDNNTWVSTGPNDWTLPAGTTVYVTSGGTDWTNGANDCLASGSGCGTPQKAYDLVSSFWDLETNTATIQFNDGTYSLSSGVTAISMLGQLHGSGRQGTQGSWLSIVGNLVTPANVVLNITNANAFACDQGCSANIQGMTINLTGGAGNQGNAFIVDNLGQLQFGTVTVTGNNGTPANHVATGNLGSQLGCIGNVTVSGTFNNAIFNANANTGFSCDSRTITFSAATTAAAFLDARSESYIEFLSNTITNPGNFTGAAFNIPSPAFVDVTSTTMPGTAGAVTFGGRIKGTTPQVQMPSLQEFTSGTNTTFNVATGATYLVVELVAGGGGGAGSGTAPGAATAGGNTCWKTSGTACTTPDFSSVGGALGSTAAGTTAAGGGTTSCDSSVTGGTGGGGSNTAGGGMVGAPGGAGPFFGGAGPPGANANGVGGAAVANTGGGGGGAGSSGTANSGGGGGGGGWCQKIVTSPATSYVYTVGAGGTAGTAGASGAAGGAGAAGRVRVWTYFNFLLKRDLDPANDNAPMFLNLAA